MAIRPVRGLRRLHGLRWPVAVLALLLGAGLLVINGCASFGGSHDPARLAARAGQARYESGRFINPQPMWTQLGQSMWRMLTTSVADSSPSQPVPVVTDADGAGIASAPRSGLRLTWYGHSTVRIDIDGHRVLLDPVWSERVSPFAWAGPRRWYPPLVPLEAMKDVDAVLISHDHYDHMDMPTLVAMKPWPVRFIVPLGVGDHLMAWGIPRERITELDWWESVRLGELRVTATPARHASGRIRPQADKALWAGWAVTGPAHRIWYSGDTGMHDDVQKIGERLGPFDVTLIESGQYDGFWPDWHMGPEQAVAAHRLARGRLLLPVHWGLFKLAQHAWTEPVQRVLAAARCAGVPVATPRPGESFEPAVSIPGEAWWPQQVAWSTAEQTPIVPTLAGDGNRRYGPAGCAEGVQRAGS